MSARVPADDALPADDGPGSALANDAPPTDDGAGSALAMDRPASLAVGSLLMGFFGGAKAAFGLGAFLAGRIDVMDVPASLRSGTSGIVVTPGNKARTSSAAIPSI